MLKNSKHIDEMRRLPNNVQSNLVMYTTGAVAKLCGVAPRTVAKWCDTGGLKCTRIPMSQDRRIGAFDLRLFLEAHKYPIPSCLVSNKVVAVGLIDVPSTVIEQCSMVDEYTLGCLVHTEHIKTLLLGDAISTRHAVMLAAEVVSVQPWVRIVYIVPEDVSSDQPSFYGRIIFRRPNINWDHLIGYLHGGEQ